MAPHGYTAPTTGKWNHCMVASFQAEVSKKYPGQDSEHGAGMCRRVHQETPSGGL